jgi:phospholipid/cholesterol/gamma-HCH transport system substrate-binding protein
MANRKIDNFKLGAFVLGGLLMLIFGLYKVSKTRGFFKDDFTLKTQFRNVGGLMIGNNIRYVGVQVGTIEKIQLINDSLIEVDMRIDQKMKAFIHKKDMVSIGTDGLVGNKLLNISQGAERSELVENGDVLAAKEGLNTDEMMLVLNKTNLNVYAISEELRNTAQRLNSTNALWTILNEKTIPENMIASMMNIKNATSRADLMVLELQSVVDDVKKGKGSLGSILRDTTIAVNLNQTLSKIKKVGDNADELTNELNAITRSVKSDLLTSKGAYNALLKDTLLALKINKTVDNVELGTASFTENMEALKHNFLFRGYFRRLDKQKKKESRDTVKIPVVLN